MRKITAENTANISQKNKKLKFKTKEIIAMVMPFAYFIFNSLACLPMYTLVIQRYKNKSKDAKQEENECIRCLIKMETLGNLNQNCEQWRSPRSPSLSHQHTFSGSLFLTKSLNNMES